MQATHCTSDMAWAVERLGPDRLRGAYAWRSLLGTGVVIAGGSDFPVESPNPVPRHLRRGRRAGRAPARIRGWQPEQRMTREEAVRSFTTGTRTPPHQETELGTLEPGKRADLIVCSADVFACPEMEIASIAPVLTLIAGEVVLDRRAGAGAA